MTQGAGVLRHNQGESQDREMGLVSNPLYALERGPGVTDQRNRFIASAVYEPASFHYELPSLNALFNNWKVSSVITLGSGRPINATIAGDANPDDNTFNDRLAGVARNS